MLLQAEPLTEGMWALMLGPSGLLVGSIIVIVVLWRRMGKKEEESTTTIAELHEARHDDLVSGLKYREEVTGKLLQDNIEDRVTTEKMIDAVKALSKQQEKTDGNVQVVKEDVREVKNIVTRTSSR